jgi:hypothetical protein
MTSAAGLSGHKVGRSQINYSGLRNVRHATQTVTVTDDLITLFWLAFLRFGLEVFVLPLEVSSLGGSLLLGWIIGKAQR